MLSVDPRKRPSAKQALDAPAGRRGGAHASGAAPRPRRSSCASGLRTPRWRPCSRPGPPSCLPFFPTGWPFLLGALAALVALLSPAAGLAVALAVPVLPLGNVSLGLALAYVPLALLWLLLFARDARSGLLFLAGPLLAPIHALPLVPVFALARTRPRAPGRARRRRRRDRRRPRSSSPASAFPLTGEPRAGRTRGQRRRRPRSRARRRPGDPREPAHDRRRDRRARRRRPSPAGLARGHGLWGVAALGRRLPGDAPARPGSCGRSRGRRPLGRARGVARSRSRSRIRCSKHADRVAAGTMVPFS